MEAFHAGLVRQSRQRRDARALQQLAIFDCVLGGLAQVARDRTPLNVLLAAAEAFSSVGVSTNEQEGLLMVIRAALTEAPVAAIRRCLEVLEERVWRSRTVTCLEVLAQLFVCAERTHWDNAATRARLFEICDVAIGGDNDRLRRVAADAAGVAAKLASAEAKKSLGEWLKHQMQMQGKRDEQQEERAVRAGHLLAGSLSPCLTSVLLEYVLKQAGARGRPQFVSAAFRCCAASAASLSELAALALLRKLFLLAPPLESTEARSAWTGAVGAVAGKLGGNQEGEEASVDALETLATQLGQNDKRLLDETGWALGYLSSARLALSRASDGRVAAVLAKAWSWPFRVGWKRGALPLLRSACAAMQDERGAAVMGEVLSRLEGAWQASQDDRPLIEEALGCIAQSLGGSLFDRLLPLRLGTAQERVHLLPVLVKHLQCTDLAFFGRFALPLLSRIPALGALLPALAVLPADVVQVWPRHVTPLLKSWLLASASAQQHAWAAQSVLRAVAAWRQTRDGQFGPLQLHVLLRFPQRQQHQLAEAALQTIADSAKELAAPLLDCFMSGRGSRACLEACAALAALAPKLAGGLMRGSLALWLSSHESKALSACCALLEAGVQDEDWHKAADRLTLAVLPGLARGEKGAWRACCALLRTGRGNKTLLAAVEGPKWESLEGGAAKHRLEAKRRALEQGAGRGCDEATAVREALLGWRDHGPKARGQAELLLQTAIQKSADANTLIGKRLSALLALPDVAVSIAAVLMLASVLRSEENELCEDWDSVCAAVLALSKTGVRELQTALLSFWMAAIKARICDEPEKAKALVGALWGWDEEALSAHRRDMKVLVERLMKRAGPNAVSEGMPTLEGKRLVSALAKKKRRKKNEYEKKHKEKDVLDDKKTKNKKKGEEEDKKKKQKKKSERFLDPDVADLMSTTTSVSSAKPKAKRDFESEFELDAQTGKPLVLDPEDEDMLRVQREESKARAKGGDCEDYEPEEEEEDRDAEEEKKRGPGKQKKSKNTMKSATEVMGGKMYKAKKAKGDLKKGKFDPFSYVKLDPKNLNRRRAGHTADQFSEMFQKKRPGVKRGHKHTKSKYAK